MYMRSSTETRVRSLNSLLTTCKKSRMENPFLICANQGVLGQDTVIKKHDMQHAHWIPCTRKQYANRLQDTLHGGMEMCPSPQLCASPDTTSKSTNEGGCLRVREFVSFCVRVLGFDSWIRVMLSACVSVFSLCTYVCMCACDRIQVCIHVCASMRSYACQLVCLLVSVHIQNRVNPSHSASTYHCCPPMTTSIPVTVRNL